MRVLILGAGAVGGYYGARLIETGQDVAFLMRPARAALLAKTGLRVQRGQADFAQPVAVLTAIESETSYDLVIISCKAYDLESAITSIAPAVTASTWVLPLLNGMRHLAALDAAFGAARVLGGVCHISVTLDADGSIRQFGTLDRLTFGSRDARLPVPQHIANALCGLGPDVVHSADILAAMWEKFAFIAALAGITCLLRGSVGEIVATADGTELSTRLYLECAQTARVSGYPLRAQTMADAERFLTTPQSPLKASMLRDVERGARTEAEHILGDLRARALAQGVDTPLLVAALTHLRVYEAQRARATR